MDETKQTLTVNEARMGEPAWRVALLFPAQGSWTEQDYLTLDSGRLVEFDRGYVEVLDMPTKEHQRIVRYLFLLLHAFVSERSLGELFFAPLPVRLWERKFREPDIVFVRPGRAEIDGYPVGADLVIEVVSDSPEDRKRDLQLKVDEYCRAQIPEYWIVDAQQSIVLVYHLDAGNYVGASFDVGQLASSRVLQGFSITVSDLFQAGKERR